MTRRPITNRIKATIWDKIGQKHEIDARDLTSEQIWAAYMLLAHGKVPTGTPTVEVHDPLCICQKPQIIIVDGMQYSVSLSHPAGATGADWIAVGSCAQGRGCTPELAMRACQEELTAMDPDDRVGGVPVDATAPTAPAAS